MKAYKASYGGFCQSITYEVGKTYSCSKLEICSFGFHACKKMVDVFEYYPYYKNIIIFEVEILGRIIEQGNKLATDKIKIIKIVPSSEYEDFKVDSNNNLIYIKHGKDSETTNSFDQHNRPIHSKTVYSSGLICERWRDYDSVGNLISERQNSGENYKITIE
jgi:hypothetical protein